MKSERARRAARERRQKAREGQAAYIERQRQQEAEARAAEQHSRKAMHLAGSKRLQALLLLAAALG